MKSIALLGFLTLTICACSARGRDAGEACAITADCRDDLACLGGTCAVPLSCPTEAPVDCGDTIPGACCQTDTPYCCARDASCTVNAAACNTVTCAGRICAGSGSCCSGFTCSRFGKMCRAAVSLAIGESCTAASQCASGRCLNGYCTKTCTATAECGQANSCLRAQSGLICVPYCSGNADCVVFGVSITCRKATDPDGSTFNGCFGG